MSGAGENDYKWTYGVRLIANQIDRATWRNTLTYRFHSRFTAGVEYSPLAKKVSPLANLVLVTETHARPALIVGTSSDRIGTPSGQSFYATFSKNVKHYTPDDWVDQVQKPSVQLQTITGKPVEYFAYPFGLWNKDAIAKLKDHEFKAVFQLADKRDENDPMHSIRRIIVPDWSGKTLVNVMKRSFH